MNYKLKSSWMEEMLLSRANAQPARVSKLLVLSSLLLLSSDGMSAPPLADPTAEEGICLLEEHKAKYVFKFKTRPTLRSRGEYSGEVRGNKEVPAALTLDFKIVDENFYSDVDLDRAVLRKVNGDGSYENVAYLLRKDTQYRCVLTWRGNTAEEAEYMFCVPAKTPEEKPVPRLEIPLFMNGGLLREQRAHQLRDLYYPDFFDIDQDGRKDVLSGSFHDFIRVYVNIADAPDAQPVFSENHSYVLADQEGKPVVHNEVSNVWMVSSPVFYDFDKNGHKDILMGGVLSFPDLWYVENTGTDKAPAYLRRRKVDLPCADGYKDGLYPVPCDLNGDGKMDLVAGSLERGSGGDRFIYFFEGLSEHPADFKFKLGERLQDESGVIRVPGYSQCSVEVSDWDGNGLEDLFAVSDGKLLFWSNQGSKTSPRLVPAAFPEIGVTGRGSLKVLSGNSPDIISGSSVVINKNLGGSFKQIPLMLLTPSPVSLSGHGTFKVLDSGEDGSREIIYSTDWGNIVRATEEGGIWKKYPVKSAGEPISLRGCVDTGENDKGYARMAVGDLDGDGLPDMLVNHELSWRFGYLSYFRNLGNGEFAEEDRLEVPPLNDLQYRDGDHGRAALFDANTPLDYFSYPASEIFDPSEGMLSLNFSPSGNSPWSEPMCLFHNQDFNMEKNLARLGEEFKVELMKDGSISWRSGMSVLQSPSMKWQKGAWYALVLKWSDSGMVMTLNGKVIAENAANEFLGKKGPRIYIGSQQSISFVQAGREYPFRIRHHEHEYKEYHPFRGLINQVEIALDGGQALFRLPLNGTNTAFAPRSKKTLFGGELNIAYRSAPALVDIDGNGLLDLILSVADGVNSRNSSEAKLYWFENVGTGQAPRFAPGVVLPSQQTDGIQAGPRSSLRFYDWDDDGDQDMFLMKTGGVVSYYRNEGTANAPDFRHRGTIVKGGWGHEAGLDVVDWDKNGDPELMLMNGDNGNLSLYAKAFLDKLEPEVMMREIVTEDQTFHFAEPPRVELPLVVDRLSSASGSHSAINNICNGIREGATSIGSWQKGFPAEYIFGFDTPKTISRIDCYFGHPLHAKRARGDQCPRSYQFEYWDESAWRPLFPKVEDGPVGNGDGVGLTASFSFPEQKTSKVRLSIYSSYDNDPSVPEEKRAAFIREIEFYSPTPTKR